MKYRRQLSTLLVVFAFGCGSDAQVVPAAGNDDASNIGSSSGVDATMGGSSSGGNDGAPGSESGDSASNIGADSASGNDGSPSDGSPSDAGIDDAFDVEIPDAFPTSCAPIVFTLVPDAAPNTCAFTPASVACDANADCVPYPVIGCGCIDPVYGVNKTSTVRCVPPPCALIPQSCDGGSGYESQDCRLAPGYNDFSAACVNHQCLSFVTGPH